MRNLSALLVKILDSLVRKLGTLRCLIPKIVQAEREREKQNEFKAKPAAPMQDFFLVRSNASGAEDGEVVKIPVHVRFALCIQRFQLMLAHSFLLPPPPNQ